MRFDYIGNDNHIDNYLKEILAFVYFGSNVNNRPKTNHWGTSNEYHNICFPKEKKENISLDVLLYKATNHTQTAEIMNKITLHIYAIQLVFSVFLKNEMFTLSAPQTKPNTSANREDPDETAHNEPSHLNLHCLPFRFQFFTDTPICNNGHIQIQGWKSTIHKYKGETIKFAEMEAFTRLHRFTGSFTWFCNP